MGLVEALSGCTELREYERPTRAPVPVAVHDEEVAFILDGHVTVTVEDAPQAILGVFGPGDVLGALAGRGPSHDRVHALGSVMLAVMPASGLARLDAEREGVPFAGPLRFEHGAALASWDRGQLGAYVGWAERPWWG